MRRSERADGENVFSVEVVEGIRVGSPKMSGSPQHVLCPQLHHVVQRC